MLKRFREVIASVTLVCRGSPDPIFRWKEVKHLRYCNIHSKPLCSHYMYANRKVETDCDWIRGCC